ncbi:MAG: hypothetical protein JXR96_14345 [Deltaproteobacteria bacterium]|nr:hypothetical protein [Deltaproteobacteria bacterium]
MIILDTLLFAIGALLVLFSVGKAVLFFRPSLIETSCLPPREPEPGAQENAIAALEHLGFERFGFKKEVSPLKAGEYGTHALANVQAGAYADVGPPASEGEEAFVFFLSVFEDGAVVLTGNYSRPSKRHASYTLQGLPGPIRDAWTAHSEQVSAFSQRHGQPLASKSPEARVRATDTYYVTAAAASRSAFAGPLLRFLLGIALSASAVLHALR